MASRQQTARSRRREEQLAEERRNRIVVTVIAAVLAIAAVIILAGLFVTQYLPPRAHVATIGERDYNAAAVLRRAEYYMFSEGGASSTGVAGIAEFTLDLLEREETLRQRAPALVGEVTEADIDAELRERLGFAEGADESGYASALQQAINDSGLEREEFDLLVEAQILMDRLREHFAPPEGATAAQADLRRIRTTTEERARQAGERLAAGENPDVVATELGTQAQEAPVNLGWSVVEELDEEVRAALEGVEPNSVTEPVPADVFWDVYLVAAREDERALDDAQRDLVATNRIEDWVAEERVNVPSERDLGEDEAQWIEDRVTAGILELLEQMGAA